jgi:sugar phosphate isomerase/epimerase
MKVGVDHYSYHRFFGEVYPGQPVPAKKMTVEGFIKRCVELECDGLTLESCFIPRFDREYLSDIKGMLDEYQMDRVYGWGHPDGLEGGKNQKAYDEMIGSFEHAKAVGAGVMKVVGSSLQFRFEPHGPQIERLSKMFSSAVKIAEKYNIKMAVENHIDFDGDEMLTLIKNVNSPYLGINFDTGNFLRLLYDPIKGMRKLAKYVLSTHVKDLKPQKGVSVDEWYFFSCTPAGEGLIDNLTLAQILKDNGYGGFLAAEIDFLHPDYNNDEDRATEKSVKALKSIAANLK